MVIFLDIDGVLDQLQGNYYLDIKCIENLAILCKNLKATIVLTSSWRLGYSNLGKCSPQVEKLKLIFSKYNIKISGRTANLGDRTIEILDYIKRYNVKNYVILDDDKSEFKRGLLDNTYIVNYRTGLTKDDIKQLSKTMKLNKDDLI